MDRVIDLSATVQREVEDYARGGTWKAVTYPVSDIARQTFAVIIVSDYPREEPTAIVVMARVVGDKVVIEEDITDKPLVEELLRAGIPREQIVLAYAGEAVSKQE